MHDISKISKSKEKVLYKIGDLVICDLIASFFSHGIAPLLELNKGYTVNNIHLDGQGNQHLDVGLKLGELNYVSSFETREVLPSPDDEHWCHPSRFHHVKIKNTMHFKHKKSGHVLDKKHFDKVPLKQQVHFATTTEKPTHRYDHTVNNNYQDDDDGTSFASTLLLIETADAFVGDTSTPSTDNSQDNSFGGFGGGDGGGGGAGGDYSSSSDSGSGGDFSSGGDSSF